MKNINKIFAIAIVALGFSTSALAQTATNTATATASAVIVAPLTIVNAGDMDFGTVYASPNARAITLSTAGGRSGSAGYNAGSPANAAHFTVTGTPGQAYTITAIAPITVMSPALGAVAMNVNAFTTDPAAGAGSLDGTTGTQTINVGATLNLNAGQVAGTYTSATPFTVTVNYN